MYAFSFVHIACPRWRWCRPLPPPLLYCSLVHLLELCFEPQRGWNSLLTFTASTSHHFTAPKWRSTCRRIIYCQHSVAIFVFQKLHRNHFSDSTYWNFVFLFLPIGSWSNKLSKQWHKSENSHLRGLVKQIKTAFTLVYLTAPTWNLCIDGLSLFLHMKSSQNNLRKKKARISVIQLIISAPA